ncbi:hypothetical protein F511_16714 [Dorcoceras hygrometricum]|uniref:Uncharacterized protein n=1 Tax=Dorcoceras hygrometricum TaxID=472368 RepID=A0A2Z7B6X3_9LAMI|nr:hypothetical protein F511_16714 [Dorcoceras hygrometricum]
MRARYLRSGRAWSRLAAAWWPAGFHDFAHWLRNFLAAGRTRMPRDGRPIAAVLRVVWRREAHWLRTMMAAVRVVAGRYMHRAWRGSARPCAARNVAAAAAVRPPSDVPGSDATANFLLGFVRACLGHPMKFSGRYSISGRFWSILKF